MVRLTLATSEEVTVNGLTVAGPVEVAGDSLTVLGETLTSGTWLVGTSSGVPTLLQTGVYTPAEIEIALPLSLVVGLMAALAGMRAK